MSETVTLFIKDVSSGTVRSMPWEHWDGSDFIWSCGKYACDCNRDIFFREAGGEPQDEDVECGDGKYIVCLMDGDRMLYEEDGFEVGKTAPKSTENR